MPRRYEFCSKLSPEEVYVRLSACAKPRKWDSCDRKTFYYGRHKNGFSLTYTGEWGRGQLPFWAKVTEKEGGSLISGGFPVWRAAWQTAAMFFGFTILITPFFGIPLRMYPAVMILLLSAVPVYAGFGRLINATFNRKKCRAILEWIQQHLLE